MAKKTGKKVKTVTNIDTKKPGVKGKEKKKPADRRVELEGELQQVLGLIRGLRARLEEATGRANQIQGAIDVLKEME